MKTKIAMVVGALAVAAISVASFAGAQTANLAATCSGVANVNVVTWTASTTGGNPPYTFAWSGTNVSGTSSVVTATYNATGTFTANLQVTDTATTTPSSTTATSNTATTTCTVQVTSLPVVTPPAPTSTPNVPPALINRPMLQIDGNGRFLARGMRVTSVASGTIQAQVWGITYTINLATGGQFLRRDGKGLFATINQQVNVGDEISASGIIDPSNPQVVNAGVVRDFSIIMQRPNRGDDDEDNEHGGGIITGTTTITLPGTSSTITVSAGDRLKDLLKQLQNLQNIFNSRQGHGGGNGDGGEGHGGN